ncbi:DUF4153 domain-containing protein [Nibrella viscosa]|uniref:DUF4153 domain-containing protein n=1 Tax=Nibrella viscosa TaxID=1084524 RepID=A0ABP8KC77_9BACT
MKETIKSNLHNPEELEFLYRENQLQFSNSFRDVYEEIRHEEIARFWQARLSYDLGQAKAIRWGSRQELGILILASLLAGLLAKLPNFLSVSNDFFYPRNIGFIVFPFLIGYFVWKRQADTATIAGLTGALLLAALYINFLPASNQSDTLLLACLHLPLFLWSLLGVAFSGITSKLSLRIAYIRYNGDLLVFTAVILLAGGLFTGLSIALFSLLNPQAPLFFRDNVVVFGLAAAPIVATYLTQANPELVGKVSPVIARLFSPLVLIMLVIYLIAVVATGKDPYNDREFLIIFNFLLIGVMAIIVFSIGGIPKQGTNTASTLVLLMLSGLTILVNLVALSAILFRLSEWGVTPNRMAVLGGNLLIFVHLLLLFTELVKVVRNKRALTDVESKVGAFLPAYALWAICVTFLFPVFFNFR